MIICIIGGIGSGKTLTAVKQIIDEKSRSYTNFKLKHINNYERIRFKDVIVTDEKVKDWRVNWDYWDKVKKQDSNFSIYLDEIHNIIHSRRSMSKENILMSKWVSQIRKILSDKPNNHLYIMSQTLRKIDIDFRELTQYFIVCKAFQIKKKTYILNYIYDSVEKIEFGKHIGVKYFVGNPYFKYYDTQEMISFGEADEYI